MASYNRTTLSTDDSGIIKYIIDNLSFFPDDIHYNYHSLVALIGEDGSRIAVSDIILKENTELASITKKIQFHSRNDVFYDEALELSKKFPDKKIICEYSYESDWHFTIHTVEIMDGKDTVIKEEANPTLDSEANYKDVLGANGSREVVKRINDFVINLYEKKLISKGEIITYEFLYKDDWKFVVQIPYGPMHETKMYKVKQKNYTTTLWKEVTPKEYDLPF